MPKKANGKKNGDKPLVFRMTDEERDRIKSHQQKEPEKEEKEPKRIKKLPERKLPVKENLLTTIFNFLKALFLGKRAQHSSKFFLRREMKKVIESFSPVFYETKIQKVKETFPFYVYEIYNFLKDLQLLFAEAFLTEKEIDFNQEIFLLSFVDNLLSEENKMLNESLNSSYFQTLILSESEPEESVNNDLKVLREKIEEKSSDAISHYTLYFEKLLQLSQYNFRELFLLFDPQFSDHPDYRPKFQPIFGNTGISEIKKFHSAILTIDFNNIPENILIHYDERLNSMKATLEKMLNENYPMEESSKDRAKILISKFNSFSKKQLVYFHNKVYQLKQKNVLQAIIRCMTDNYEYKGTAASKKVNFIFKQYLKLTAAKKRYIFEKTYEGIEYSLMQRKIFNFFKVSTEAELSSIENYNQEISEKLEERGAPTFRYILAVSLFKSFHEKLYKGTIRKAINTLLVEGDFLDKKEQGNFSEAYYNLDKLIDKFQLLDEEMTEGERDMGHILRFAWGEISDPSFQVVVQRKINDVEARLRKILKEGLKLLAINHSYIKWTVDDVKKNKITFINNIKTIAGVGNKNFLNLLNKANDSFDILFSIIQSFPDEDLMKD